MKPLIIFGIQNFADMAHYLFSTDSDYEVIGFTVDREFAGEPRHMGLPVYAYEDLPTLHPPGSVDLFVAIGIKQLNQAREQKVAQVRRDGYRLASYISSASHPANDLEVGPNTMIMENVILHPFIEIGDNVVIWSNSRIALKTKVEENCWITSAVIGESCVIGKNCFVGLNVIISPGLTIGAYNILGAGALITSNTGDYEVYKGVKSVRSKISSKRIQNYSIIS
jgi:sugar O-acyltransferase (sialic acid O-acetyltransferase NeuD family)